MPRRKRRSQAELQFEYHAEEWVSCRIAGDRNSMPRREDAATAETTRSLPPNFRWALDEAGLVLVGDLRGAAGQLSPLDSRRRLQTLANSSSRPAVRLDESEIASELGQLGWEWKEEGAGWHTSVTRPGGDRCELSAEADDFGLRVSSTLATWEGTLKLPCRKALATFLCLANGRLRFARVFLAVQQVRAESTARADRFAAELPDSVSAVLAASRTIGREVRALLVPEVAAAYLENVS